MLSTSTRRSLAIITTLMYISSSGPMRWDGKKQRLQFVSSKLFAFSSITNYILMTCFEFFLAFRCYQVMFPPEGQEFNLPLVCHMLYTLSCYAIPVHLQTNTLLRWGEVPNFINSFIDFFRVHKEKRTNRNGRDPSKNGCERLCIIFICLASLITLQNCVLIMKKPESLFFLTSLLADSGRTFSFWKLCMVAIHLHIWLSFWAQLLFYGLTQYIYAFPCLFIMKLMTRQPLPQDAQCVREEKPLAMSYFMSMYRCIQVEHNMFQYCYGDVFLPGHKVTMATSVVFSIYGAIKLHGNRAVLMAFVAGTGLLYLSVLFRRLGKFHELSEALLNSWRGERNGNLKRFLKSSRPVQVTIGSYYAVTGETVMSLGAIIANAAINMLLSF